MNYTRCAICGDIVLRLMGHDITLDTAFLTKDTKDRALQRRVFGDVHSSCLAASECASDWMKAFMERRLRNSRVATLCSSTEGFLQYLPQTQEFFFWYARAYYARVPASALDNGLSSSRGMLLQVVSPVSVDLTSIPNFGHGLEVPLRTGGYRLASLLLELGVAEKYGVHSPISDAAIRPFHDEPIETFEALKRGYLEAELLHKVLLPQEYLEKIHATSWS